MGRFKNYSSVSPLTEKETRCLGIFVCKMSSVLGTSGLAKRLLHILFAKCPAFGTFANSLSEVIF